MKVLLVQFDPEFKNVEGNKLKASRIISANTAEIDLIILPEMIFTGYCFKSKADILPYCEDTQGLTFQWANNLAISRNCLVQLGYPRVDGGNLFNSLMLVSPNGLVTNYDKHFLYEVDECWAEEGASFKTESIDIGNLKRGKVNQKNVGFGICMDLSPYQFKAPFDAFEFGNFQANHDADLVLCCMAWLIPRESADDGNSMRDGHNSSSSNPNDTATNSDVEYQMLNYWALRLSPLVRTSKKKTTTVFICNRTGTEGTTTFGGTSCGLRFKNGNVQSLGYMTCKEEGSLLIDVDL